MKPDISRPPRRNLARDLARNLGAALAGLFVWTTCALAQGAGAPPPTAVDVVTLRASDVTLTSTLPGRVAASSEAEVRPQVSGIITERLYEEGRTVEKDAALYQIDPASYEAQKAAAEAQLAQAEAALAQAEREAERQSELVTRSVTSRQTYDDAVAARDVAAAAVKVAQANLLSAEIDLERTTIRAPISGIAGLSLATRGALVTSGQATALTVIRALDPVHVDVTQSAADILRWRRAGIELESGSDAVVKLRLADGEIFDHTGRLAAAEPHVNEQTGVVVLRLEFPNPDNFLLPGMYVQVEIPQVRIENAILAPQEGVTRDRRGQPIAMVVNDQDIVELRSLTVQRDQGSDWVVTDGLAAGDRLVVSGLQKIAAGMQVTPEERAPDAAPDTAPDTAKAPTD